METAPEQVTRILEAVGAGDPQAAEKLLPLVYEELRRLAAAKMAGNTADQTLQPTALVHEAWLRLVGHGERDWRNRSYFFAAAAEAMRRILVERARRKSTEKHGAGLQRVDLDHLDVAEEAQGDILIALDEALTALVARDPVAAELIKLRFFTGIPNVQAAEILGVPERTAKRTWAYARAWLYQEIKKKV